MAFLTFLYQVANRENLSAEQAREAMICVLSGEATTAQIAGFLIALRMKGETPDELLGFARAMREKATPVPHGITSEPVLDTCGTGGDGQGTFNVSTAAALVVAGAGVKVAKHGNRSISTQCGSADVFEGLGVNITAPVERMSAAIREVGIGFLFAPAIHPAMRNAQPARQEVKLRTAFNLLGPLTNPAGATAQLIGAPSIQTAELMAEALACLGIDRAFVVHGLDGLDEVSTTGETFVLEIHRGTLSHRTWTPSDFRVEKTRVGELKGGDCSANCEMVRALLAGQRGPRRDIVLVNAAVALMAAGRAETPLEGMDLAARSIDSGAAAEKLEALIRFSAADVTVAGR